MYFGLVFDSKILIRDLFGVRQPAAHCLPQGVVYSHDWHDICSKKHVSEKLLRGKNAGVRLSLVFMTSPRQYKGRKEVSKPAPELIYLQAEIYFGRISMYLQIIDSII